MDSATVDLVLHDPKSYLCFCRLVQMVINDGEGCVGISERVLGMCKVFAHFLNATSNFFNGISDMLHIHAEFCDSGLYPEL